MRTGVEPSGSGRLASPAALVVPPLTPEQQALDAKALNALAWPRVAPPGKPGKVEERTVFGEEALGLACARAALKKAYTKDDEYQYLDTLAWARRHRPLG